MSEQDEQQAPEPEPRAAHVVEAIARVMRDLPPIAKVVHQRADESGERGVRYPYRGIEEITAVLQGLLSKHCVVIVPRTTQWTVHELTINSRPWEDHRLMVEFDAYGPGGPSDKITLGPVCAIGRDNADKGTSKAHTQAYKVALIEALCIGDSGSDNDGVTDQADERPRAAAQQQQRPPQQARRGGTAAAATTNRAQPTAPGATQEERQTILAWLGQLDEDARAAARRYCQTNRFTVAAASTTKQQLDELERHVTDYLDAREDSSAPGDDPIGD